MLAANARHPAPHLREPAAAFQGQPLLDCDIELAAAQSLVAATPSAIVDVCGPHGCGKTALVRRIEGACYINAAGLDTRAVVQSVYTHLFAQEGNVSVPDPERLGKLLHGKRVPIVIDDFEGSADELRAIVEALKPAPVVYTSVEPSLTDPSVSELRLTGLRTEAARELFERAFGASIEGDAALIALVSNVFEGNPLLILQAAALARTGKLPTLQSAAPLAAAIFNSMNIGEQQVFATVAGFNGARPDRETVEAVSGVANAAGVINALVSRSAIEADDDRLRISPLMYSVLSVTPSLVHYDVMFDYTDRLLAEEKLPQRVVENPEPFLVALRLSITKGRHSQVMKGARNLADALLLAGSLDAARKATELVRDAANELRDQVAQAWSQHQLGTLAELLGDRADAISWLESAVLRRERMGDQANLFRSQENLAIVQGRPSPAARRTKNRSGFGRDLGLIAGAMAVAAAGAVTFTVGWHPFQSAKQHTHGHGHTAHSAPVVAKLVEPPPTPEPTVAPLVAPKTQLRALPVSRSTRVVATPGAPTPRAVAAPAPAVQAPPRILSFAPKQKTIFAGQTTSLCYDVAGAARASIDRLGSIALGSACVSVRPQHNEQYTLVASRGRDSVHASTGIHVTPRLSLAPRIVRLTSTARRIVLGQYTQICFTVLHAGVVILEPLGELVTPRSGCVTVSPRIDTFYRLYVRNNAGVVSAQVHVAVLPEEALNR